jgi:hypothetical protein
MLNQTNPRDLFLNPKRMGWNVRDLKVQYLDQDTGEMISTKIRRPFDPENPLWRKVLYFALLNNAGHFSKTCQQLRIARMHLYNCFDQHPEFEKEFRKVQERALDSAEDELRRRGIDGWDHPIYFQGQRVGIERQYSDFCLKTILGAYRSRFNTTIKFGGDETPIKLEHGISERLLNDADANKLAHALLERLAGDSGGDGEPSVEKKVDPDPSSDPA